MGGVFGRGGVSRSQAVFFHGGMVGYEWGTLREEGSGCCEGVSGIGVSGEAVGATGGEWWS